MRRRNMYYATGLPGWMRFGYSPGWGGMPPGAQFLETGQWPTPQAQQAWEAMQGGQPPMQAGQPPMQAGQPPMQAGQPPMQAGQGPMQPQYGPPPGAPMWGGYPPDPQQQVQFLSEQLAMISEHLQMITDEIAAMEQASGSDE